MCRRVGAQVALRFPDPERRHDDAGRIIPHDIVVQPPLADDIRSVEGGQQLVWPMLAAAFERLWDQPRPPSTADIKVAFTDDPGGLGTDNTAYYGHTSRR